MIGIDVSQRRYAKRRTARPGRPPWWRRSLVLPIIALSLLCHLSYYLVPVELWPDELRYAVRDYVTGTDIYVLALWLRAYRR